MTGKIHLIKEKYNKMPLQIQASLWFLICSFMQKGISVITTPIFTRLLSTSEYGSFGTFNSWLNVIQIIVSLNLTAGVYTQGLVKFNKDRDAFSSSIQGLTLSLCIFWLLVYLAFKNFWNDLFSLSTIQMLCMLVMIWASSVFNQWAAEQRVKLNYRVLVIITIIVSILKPGIGVIFVTHAQDKVTARILGLAIVELLLYTVFFFIQIRKGKIFFSKFYWKYALLFNIPLLPHFLSQSVLNSADRIMIERMIGASEAGIYNLAYSLSFLMTLFNTALLQTINPWIFQKIKDRKERDINPIAVTCLIFVALLNLLLIYFAPEVVYVFAPNSYGDAVNVIPPITMSVFFIFMSYFFVDFELYYEKTVFITIATIISAVANVVLNYIFIKFFGYYAAGYTTLLCYIMYMLGHFICMRVIRQKMNENADIYNIKAFSFISAGFLIIGFLGLFSYSLPILRYSILGILIIIVYIKRDLLISETRKLIKMRKRK